jgi:hypothetical protein
VGESSVSIPVEQAFPAPPDVAVVGEVPGGAVFPCTPQIPRGAPVRNRTEWLIPFAFTQGQQLRITRIRVALPVFLEEGELDKGEVVDKSETKFKTEGEVNEEEARSHRSDTSTTWIGYETRYEKITTTVVPIPGTALTLVTNTHTASERSVLPVTVTVIARLTGPDGPIWSSSWDVPLHYAHGEAGHAFGTGTIEEYIDLNNGLTINPEQPLTLALLVSVPSTVKSNIQIGPEFNTGTGLFVVAPNGEVELYYETEPVAINK